MRKGELAPPSGPTAAVDALSLRHALFWIAVAFSSFQIITAAYSPLPSQIVRAVHVGFLTLMVFGIEAERTAGSGWSAKRLLAWLAGAVAFALSFYHWIFQADLIQRSGEPTALDLAVG